jgi:hypothetical protein
MHAGLEFSLKTESTTGRNYYDERPIIWTNSLSAQNILAWFAAFTDF